MTEHESFIAAAKAAVPGISKAEIGRRSGVSRSAIGKRAFNVQNAVKVWNSSGSPELCYIPARVEPKDGA
ncbi:MAG: hypothetical protein AAFV53_37240 [Myxococcota bacterium]